MTDLGSATDPVGTGDRLRAQLDAPPETAVHAPLAEAARAQTARLPGAPMSLRRGFPVRYLATPAVLAVALLALWVYLQSQELDSIEQRSINADEIVLRLGEHIKLTVVSTVLVVIVAVSLGVLLTRPFARRITPFAVNIANVGQAVPSVGLLVLLALVWDIGFWPAVVALVVYSLLPVLRNTMVGLEQVDRTLLDAGRGMGMTKGAVLRRIELPLAVPVILAGVRTALVINVGTAALATLVNAGGLGGIILNGIQLDREPVLLTGSVLVAVLALAVDWVAGIAEDVLRPKGL